MRLDCVLAGLLVLLTGPDKPPTGPAAAHHEGSPLSPKFAEQSLVDDDRRIKRELVNERKPARLSRNEEAMGESSPSQALLPLAAWQGERTLQGLLPNNFKRADGALL